MPISIDSENLATLMRDSLGDLSPSVQDLLFQTKKEQTFSALLAGRIQTNLSDTDFECLVELKGKEKSDRNGSDRKNRNTHDVCIIDADGKFQLILENKVWYHFDGAKGARKKVVNPNVEEQLVPDLQKIRVTALENSIHPKGIVMICLVTPSDISQLPKAYAQDHLKALRRTDGNSDALRQEGIDGVISILQKYQSQIADISHVGSEEYFGLNKCGFVDVFAAEILLKQK